MAYDIDPAQFEGWLIGARARTVTGDRITPRKIMGKTLIFHRTAEGRAVALDARCPHKGVSLAEGRLRDGEVECPYHGWRFSSEGACTTVPSSPPDEKLPCATLRSWPVVEQEGWLWIYWGQSEERGSPPSFPVERGQASFEFEREVKAPPHFILENSFDCVHACYAHHGVVRKDPVQEVDAEVEETPTGVRVTTVERQGVKSLVTRFLPFGSSDVRHTDELVLPFTAHVSYFLGRVHHQTILTTVPIDASTTRVHTRTIVDAGWLTWPATLFFWLITPFVIRQDVVILENQAATFDQYGEPYAYLRKADLPALWVMRAYRRALEGRPAPTELRRTSVQYRL